MIKNTIHAVLLAILFVSCNKERKLNNEKEVFNYVVDSLINVDFSNYDLCGKFNDEYSDSILWENHSVLDTFISRTEFKVMVDKYKSYKGKSIKLLLNHFDDYKYKESKSYDLTKESDIFNHFCLSYPLLSGDKNTALVFFTGYNLKEMVIEDYIILFKRINRKENWEVYLLDTPFPPSNEYHNHKFSLIPPDARSLHE